MSSRWTVRVLVSAAALVASALPWSGRAPAAHAQEDQLVQALVELLEGGRVSEAEEIVTDERFGAISTRPAILRRICEAAHRGSSLLVGFDPTKAKAIAATLVETATAASEAAAEEPDALWSLALARVTRGRMERDSGGAPDPADWTESAGLLEKAWGLAHENGAPAATAADVLLDAAGLPGAAADGLRKRADDLVDAALAKHPESGPLLRTFTARTLERAGAEGVKKADSVALVKAALDRIGPAARKQDPDVDAATAWNDLAAFDADRKLGLKTEPVTRKVRFASKLEMDVPVSRWLRVDDSSPGETQIVQVSPKGLQRRRIIRFDVYKWEIAYTFGAGTEAGGDNLKGIAAANLGYLRGQLYEKGSFKDVSKGRLNGRIGGAYVWESVGRREKGGDETRIRAWYFKSEKGHMVTYEVEVEEWDRSETDFLARTVLESITELARPK